MIRSIRFFITVLGLAITPPARAADLDAVKADWNNDLARYEDVVVEFVTRASVKNGADKSTQENKGQAKKLGPNRLAYLDQAPKTVSIANEKYFFTATEGSNGGWTLGVYGRLTDERVGKPLNRLNDLSANALALYSIGGVPLHPNLDAFRAASETDVILTIVSSRDLEGSNSSNKVRLSDVRVLLDKKNRYQPISAECQQHVNKSHGKLTVVYKTDPPTGTGQRSTITTTEVYGTALTGLVIEATTEYKFQFRAGLKDSDFRLTAYGIAEPSDVVWEKPTPTYVWLLVVAGVFGLLALLLAYLKRRSDRQRQSKTGTV